MCTRTHTYEYTAKITIHLYTLRFAFQYRDFDENRRWACISGRILVCNVMFVNAYGEHRSDDFIADKTRGDRFIIIIIIQDRLEK